jgi:hypothetical protein
MDMAMLIGMVDERWRPGLADAAREFGTLIGFDLVQLPGREMYTGGTDHARAWLTWDPEENEPFRSHPYNLELAAGGMEDPLRYVDGLFERLAGDGRFRIVLLIDQGCVRSTHFPCDQW